MCDTYVPPSPEDAEKPDLKLKPLPTNTRHACAEAMEKAKAEVPWFGIEQVNYITTIQPFDMQKPTCRAG